ncbi:hypothetical protein PS2_010338 [Malus domestica]
MIGGEANQQPTPRESWLCLAGKESVNVAPLTTWRYDAGTNTVNGNAVRGFFGFRVMDNGDGKKDDFEKVLGSYFMAH